MIAVMNTYKNDSKIIYKIYARKSSEAEDRQTLSIDSQIEECKKIASSCGIKIEDEDIFTESHSAKEAYDRPIFEELIDRIENGKIQGIISWHPNRLSRNAIDSARLVDLFDKGKLKEIVTHQQIFKNTPSDKFVFQLLCSQAKMENDNKSIDVKRGLRKKHSMGFPPHLAKIGYINDCGKKGDRKWLLDPERFNLVKQVLESFLSGRYSVRTLCKYAERLGLKTVQRKKEGGKPLQASAIYTLLKDPFYAGFFYAKNENDQEERYEANESIPRMITEEQYWQIQAILGRKGRPCPSKHLESFPYKRFITCGSCGGPVTAEHKYQLICPSCKLKFAYTNRTSCPKCGIKIAEMENPTYLHYIYYHCLKRKNPECKEKSLQETIINNQIADYFENHLEISPALKDWCLKHFNEIIQKEKENELDRRVAWENEKNEKGKEYFELVRMKTRNMIDEDDFIQLRESLRADIKTAEESLASLGGSALKALEGARKAFNLAVGVAEIFRQGGFGEKETALSEICSNLTMKDKNMLVSEKKLYSAIINGLKEAKSKNKAFEPKKYEENKGKTEVISSVCPTLLRC